MRRYGRLLFILFFLLTLTGCGFQLRGATPLSPTLKKLYVQTANPYGQLARNLNDSLKGSGVQLTDSPHTANAILEILPENESQELLSVSGTQQTRQYNLVLTVSFRILDPQGKLLINTQTVSESRTFTALANQILGGTNEANTLYQQMRLSIVYDIMNRLGSRDITQLLTEHK